MTYVFELFTDAQNQHRVRIDAPNGETIFTNGQGLANKSDLVQMLTNFIEGIKKGNFEIRRDGLPVKME